MPNPMPRWQVTTAIYTEIFSENSSRKAIARNMIQRIMVTKGDVRDINSIAKLVRDEDGPEEIEQIMKTLNKYGVR